MKSRILGALVALFCTSAFATHTPTPPPVDPPVKEQPYATADAAAAASASAGAAALAGANVSRSGNSSNENDNELSASQGQGQGQQQGQVAAADASNAGVTQGVSLNQTYKQVKQAVPGYADAGNATSQCQKDRRFGLGTALGGLSLGGSKTDKECRIEQAADYELAQGNVLASIKMRCKLSYYKDTLGSDCEALLSEQPSALKQENEQLRRALAVKKNVEKASK